ncbi:14-3-3 protein theta [Camelus dromedarius]|uniref:14-3-3 protein theta n=1 Tax=Camelus dromedarius TaxID=9838 RepID=A0A5N4CQR9_CAMDR|nr:14-3-3 protein theta [Camelus dromedarius]
MEETEPMEKEKLAWQVEPYDDTVTCKKAAMEQVTNLSKEEHYLLLVADTNMIRGHRPLEGHLEICTKPTPPYKKLPLIKDSVEFELRSISTTVLELLGRI